ncbi:NADP-dependent oxidoreductase domain-containing protein [Coniella lustricola]|uniref:NADP-dependent oxidoreductase domain-containing protein n=1 Tax=Coniella lustricola TaxID=2025994 RepID=A0A2T2ZXX8_9PEZI|nr:NADP-dependent oxidoreductase domain-containing protein [Coniella lustricola]
MRDTNTLRPERTMIGGSLEIPRILNGLWQLAGGHDQDVDIAHASGFINTLIDRDLDCFDMADHYGDAELVIGHYNRSSSPSSTGTASTNRRPIAFTKWCPPEADSTKTFAQAEAAIDLALQRTQQKQLALLQYHIWDYTNDLYIHNLQHLTRLHSSSKIAHIGLTNTDSAHLAMLLDTGFPIVTNQVACSVLDRRVVRGRMSALCVERGVGLLCYGTLLGGFVSEKWLDAPEPAAGADSSSTALNWSLRKYLRFIHAAGGWQAFQVVLKALDVVARKHNVPVAAVAIRWVLDIPAVKAVIVGTRLNADSEAHARQTLLAFSFSLDDEDRALVTRAQDGLQDIPGDCGDEYRRPPYLTAAGDLSHHIKPSDRTKAVREAIAKGQRIEYLTGSPWEPICGYCRAVRIGSRIHVSGTTANPPRDASTLTCIGGTSAASQTVWILDIIEGSLKALDASMKDIVRTRVILRNSKDCEAVSQEHGWKMKCAGILPANTLIQAGLYESQMLVEVESWAEVGSAEGGTLQISA